MHTSTPTSCTLPATKPALAPRRWPPLKIGGAALGLALAFAFTSPVQALSVRQMTLGDLCINARHIVRGEVVDVSYGSVQAGGGTLPTVTYRLKIKEAFAGQRYGVFEFTCLGSKKNPSAAPVGQAQRQSTLELPVLKQGQEYLLFTTQSSRIGLSSLVGLGQGCFSIQAKGDKETAVNERMNVGLGLPRSGPLPYEELAAAIRRNLAK